MAINKGKSWEAKFKNDFKKSFPDGTIDRLYDPTNGYLSINNINVSFNGSFVRQNYQKQFCFL